MACDYKAKEKSTYEDLEYVVSFAQEKLLYDIKSIILWGFSLGTGPTIEIASRYQNLGGIVLQSPLASLMIWMDKNATWDYNYCSSDIYCSINKIENIKAKLFVIHGKRDKTIDVRHSHLLYDKYVNSGSDNNQIWLVIAEGAGHNDIQFLIEDCGGPFYKRIQKFLEMIRNPLRLLDSKSGSKNYEKFRKREENKMFFYEKEINSLKISFNKLLINSLEVEDHSKKVDSSAFRSEISEKQTQDSPDSINGNGKENDEKQIFENLLKKNEDYISKEIPHDINMSLLNEISLKKCKSATNANNSVNGKNGNVALQSTIKEFVNVNDLLITNYFEKI